MLSLVPPLLSACASDGEQQSARTCPQVAILRSVEKMDDYGSDTIDPANLVASATMQRVDGKCEYADDGVDVAFTISMKAEKGPRLGGEAVNFPFFISLVDAEDKVRGKEIMTAEFVFSEGSSVSDSTQPIHVMMPLGKDEDAGGFRVLVGFQMTEEQLDALEKKTP